MDSDSLTPEQAEFIRLLTSSSEARGNRTFMLLQASDGSTLVGTANGQDILDVPDEEVFYEELAELGYLRLKYGRDGTLHISPTRKAVACKESDEPRAGGSARKQGPGFPNGTSQAVPAAKVVELVTEQIIRGEQLAESPLAYEDLAEAQLQYSSWWRKSRHVLEYWPGSSNYANSFMYGNQLEHFQSAFAYERGREGNIAHFRSVVRKAVNGLASLRERMELDLELLGPFSGDTQTKAQTPTEGVAAVNQPTIVRLRQAGDALNSHLTGWKVLTSGAASRLCDRATRALEELQQLHPDAFCSYALGPYPGPDLDDYGDERVPWSWAQTFCDEIELILGMVEQLGLEDSASVALEAPEQPADAVPPNRVFLVHGRDEAAKHSVARLLESLDLECVILDEKADRGQTLIEKVELHSEVGFAVVLLTPDDKGCLTDEEMLRPRARQNVILELGFFLGKLGRSKVCALYKQGVEIPSDYQGVLWVNLDPAGAWKLSLAREMKGAGLPVDLNKIVKV